MYEILIYLCQNCDPNNVLFISWLLKSLFIIIAILLLVAYLTYFERRLIGFIQLRKGPSVTGWMGLLQPIADGIKLLFKQTIIPLYSNKKLFLIAPIVTFSLALCGFAVIPFSPKLLFADINLGVLYILAISSLAVYGIIIAGWASNSQYAFLGAIRSSAQIISYELSVGLCLISLILMTKSLRLIDIIDFHKNISIAQTIMILPIAIIFFISMLAETNRLPFDLPEAEAELVAGYNVEYSSMGFAMFFLGEYANMVFTSSIFVVFFMGGYLPPFNLSILGFIPPFVWFALKVSFLLFVFLWIRGVLPRYRYDQLMRIGWKLFLPITLFWVMLTSSLIVLTDLL